MTLNGKRNGFSLADFRAAGNSASMKKGRAEQIVGEVTKVVSRWPEFAAEAKLDDKSRDKIQKAPLLEFPEGFSFPATEVTTGKSTVVEINKKL